MSFAVFVDDEACSLVTVTNAGANVPSEGPLSAKTNATKKTLVLVGGTNEKENIDPRTGLRIGTRTLVHTSPTRDGRKRRAQARGSTAGALATTAYKGKPVVARTRPENGAAGPAAKKRRTNPTPVSSPVRARAPPSAFRLSSPEPAPVPARPSSFMASLLEDVRASSPEPVAPAAPADDKQAETVVTCAGPDASALNTDAQ